MSASPRQRLQVNAPVFWGASATIFAILVPSVLMPKQVERVTGAVRDTVVGSLGWLYVFGATAFLLFVAWLALSRHGRIRLGPDDARPEFSRASWFAMLFSAGMGIGLMFFSVAEPLTHFGAYPEPAATPQAAASRAMGLTFFHWGLHPWGIYALAGLAFAYFTYRRGLPLSMRSALQPLLGERIHGRIGDAVDGLAIVSTLFGVATSLGLGVMQIAAGLDHVAGVSATPSLHLGLIAAITFAATISVVTGLKAGVRRLSEANMGLAAVLLLLVVVLGPTLYLGSTLVEGLLAYFAFVPTGAVRTKLAATPAMQEWMSGWTIFYWAWWISWAPFVGIFIARISRGRTIREFIIAVLLVPCAVGFVWLSVFGGAGLHLQLHGSVDLAAVASDSAPTAIFVLLEHLPLAAITSVICMVCVVLFFVTSSDSASLVIDTIASGGHPDPPVGQRIYWAVLEGAVAAVLLLAGGLKALQTGVIATALPFTVLLALVCVALLRALSRDRPPAPARPPS